MRAALQFAAGAALCLSACSPASDDNAPTDAATDTLPMDEATANPDAPITAEDAAVPQGAQGFVNSVAAIDMFEVESSRLAVAMAKSQAVKDFAATMAQEHTQSDADLKATTAAMIPPLTVAPMLDPAQEADLAALRTAGDNFDRLYLAQQTVAHEKAFALVRGYAGNGPVQPLKDFAAKAAPKIEAHLQQVRAIKP